MTRVKNLVTPLLSWVIATIRELFKLTSLYSRTIALLTLVSSEVGFPSLAFVFVFKYVNKRVYLLLNNKTVDNAWCSCTEFVWTTSAGAGGLLVITVIKECGTREGELAGGQGVREEVGRGAVARARPQPTTYDRRYP